MIANCNGTELDWDSYEFSEKEKKGPGHRRADKAENVLCIRDLPVGTSEEKFREFIGERLDDELLGLIYYCTMDEDGTSCYISFITHRAMKDARSILKKGIYSGVKYQVESADIDRAELISQKLNKPLDDTPPLSFFLSSQDLCVNLVIMVMIWLITVFDFYLVGFLVNTFEQIFLSTIASGVSEFVAQAFGG